jgi:hypothetical protein
MKRRMDHHPDHNAYQRFNKWLAIKVTNTVGSMTCAYIFTGIALISLPAAIASHNVIIIVSWIAQTFLQLVLLSVILVGQNVESQASDARAIKTFDDVEHVIDLLRLDTEGGLQELYDKLHADITARSQLTTPNPKITAGDLLEAKKQRRE